MAVPLVAVCLLCNALVFTHAAVETPVGLAFSLAAAAIPAIFYSGLVILLDRYEREPTWILFGTFFWGALVATVISFLFNSAFHVIAGTVVSEDAAAVLTASISAPIVEESAKGAALLLLYLLFRREFDDVLDGILYGSLVGIGFAMTENVSYFVDEYSRTGLLGLSIVFYLRVILVGLGHAAYTATTGAGFGYARETTSPVTRVMAPMAGWALAVLQHFAWNFLASFLIGGTLFTWVGPVLGLIVVAPLVALALTGPPIVLLLVLVVLTWRRQARIIEEQLRDEVTVGVLTSVEYARLSSKRQRMLTEWCVLMEQGIGAWRVQSKLHQAATELAFRKWHISRGDVPQHATTLALNDEIRERIRALRRRLTGQPPCP